ncbi:MAG: hypothetical protein FGM44_05740 [Limnohabitans sp.]|nr:hypothetical protein [Limnohabitans sp.]
MSHDRLENYLHTSLSCAGFVLLDAELACGMRPDLWGANGGLEAAYEMARPHNANKINAIPGQRFLLRLKGHGRDIEVIARSADMLDQRITWATGREVLDLIPHAELEGVAMPDPAMAAKPRANRISDDLYHGTPTAEPGRTCGQCDRLAVSGACTSAKDSGITQPAANVLRRCLVFVPLWGSDDSRTGLELWPEIAHARIQS